MQQNEIKRLFKRFKELKENKSIPQLLCQAAEKISVYLETPYQKINLKDKSFSLQGKNFNYYVHAYNATWKNERTIEIPLGLYFLERFQNLNIVELGNVMSYYSEHKHTVIDKYENSPGVLNFDIMDYKPGKPFDAFLSISTMEHIGWDEEPKTPEKVRAAFSALPALLTADAPVLITFPLGYNSTLDEMVATDSIPFETTFVVRVSKYVWREVSRQEAQKVASQKAIYSKINSLCIASRGLFKV